MPKARTARTGAVGFRKPQMSERDLSTISGSLYILGITVLENLM